MLVALCRRAVHVRARPALFRPPVRARPGCHGAGLDQYAFVAWRLAALAGTAVAGTAAATSVATALKPAFWLAYAPLFGESHDIARTLLQKLESTEGRGAAPEAPSSESIRVEAARQAFRSDVGWEPQGTSMGFSVDLRRGPGDLETVRMDGIMEVPTSDIAAVMYEVEKWKQWVPSLAGMGLREAARLAADGPARHIVHLIVGMPWPLSNRDMVLAVECADCLDAPVSGSSAGSLDAPGALRADRACGAHEPQLVVLIDSDAVNEFPDHCRDAVPAPGRGSHRQKMMDSAVLLTPTARGTRVQVILSSSIDVFVPTWLLSIAITQMTGLVLSRLAATATRVHKERVLGGPVDVPSPFFSWIQPRLEEAELAAATR